MVESNLFQQLKISKIRFYYFLAFGPNRAAQPFYLTKSPATHSAHWPSNTCPNRPSFPHSFFEGASHNHHRSPARATTLKHLGRHCAAPRVAGIPSSPSPPLNDADASIPLPKNL
jgi:hypothetical protein